MFPKVGPPFLFFTQALALLMGVFLLTLISFQSYRKLKLMGFQKTWPSSSSDKCLITLRLLPAGPPASIRQGG